MIIFILKYLFLFVTGSILGWMLEVFYRRYFGKARKWINPGFLSGPYLPLYGSGMCLLYIVSDLNINFIVKILFFAFITTMIEYVTGLFFLKYYKTRLWDYTKFKFNIQGLIAPLYTLFWTILSLFFYYVLYPYFYNKIEFLYQHLEFSLFIGVFYGVVIVDIINSFSVVIKFKKYLEMIENSKLVINIEEFKEELKNRFHEISNVVDEFAEKVEELENEIEHGITNSLDSIKREVIKPNFLLPFRGEVDLFKRIQNHIDKFSSSK